MIPLIVKILGPEVIQKFVKYREYIIFTIQDVAEDALFFSWVLHEATEFEDIDQAMSLLEKCIDAFLYIEPLPIIVARYHEEINKYDFLKSYFYKFPGAKEHLQLHEAKQIDFVDSLTDTIIDTIADILNFDKPSEEEKDSMLRDLAQFWDWFTTNLEIAWNAFIGKEADFIDYACQQLKHAEYPSILYSIPEWLVFFLNPYVEIDWAQIKTMIMMLNSLGWAKVGYMSEIVPKPYIKGTQVSLMSWLEKVSVGYLNYYGNVEMKGKIGAQSWTDLYFNMHGLVMTSEIFDIAINFRVYNVSQDDLIYGDDALCTWHYYYRDEDFKYVHVINIEDRRESIPVIGPGGADWDDAQIRIYEHDVNTYYVEIYKGESVDTHDYYYITTFLATRGSTYYKYTPPKEKPPQEALVWSGFIDRKTKKLLE